MEWDFFKRISDWTAASTLARVAAETADGALRPLNSAVSASSATLWSIAFHQSPSSAKIPESSSGLVAKAGDACLTRSPRSVREC